MAKDFETRAHLEWLGYVQPVGMVVNPPALLAAQVQVNINIRQEQSQFIDLLTPEGAREPLDHIPSVLRLCVDVLGWRTADLEPVDPTNPAYSSLEVPLVQYGETLRPTHVVRHPKPRAGQQPPASPWMMVVQELAKGTDLDEKPTDVKATSWQESPHVRFERLLRETQIPLGLLSNGQNIRLVYAPRGESSGYITFNVPQMASVAGRPIFAALHMLLCEFRLFTAEPKYRLPTIVAESRRYQNEVSTQLAGQVLEALYALVRGFQAAHEQTSNTLLKEVLAEDPDIVYQGLLTVLMRTVFVLYAEDRGLLSSDPVFIQHYSMAGLYERLRSDDGRFSDTMNQRYGAWAQVLALFRVLHDGAKHKKFKIPARRGHLFDPDTYPFLEGRRHKTLVVDAPESFPVPRVSDGVVYQVLRNLLILNGERLSYRTLDVEEIGSVYETMMGFTMQVAAGRSIAIKAKKAHGASAIVNLDDLLALKPAERAKVLKEQTDQELNAAGQALLKTATTVEQLAAALEDKIAKEATPRIVPLGSMVLQPSDARRRSGSHYTPRSLTEPIVKMALEPILVRLGALPPYPLPDGTVPAALPYPQPQQILELCICDPAMGSGAFLVEACRQLAEVLVKSWYAHQCVPEIPPDEDDLLCAKRLVAQRCLYGVDKNPMAVNLAKLSLWLATLAKDHAFTFVDHALRSGDSLVGLTKKQIVVFNYAPDVGNQREIWGEQIERRVRDALRSRQAILEAGDFEIPERKRQRLALVEQNLKFVRFVGDLVVAAFFTADNPRAREAARLDYQAALAAYLGPSVPGIMAPRPEKYAKCLHAPEPTPENPHGHGVIPFHWEIEFPEVLGRNNPGFDAIVGNPPFAGKNTIIGGHHPIYTDWLKMAHEGAHGNADLVAHFFRRAFDILRNNSAMGLIATNTIAQGDTRSTGLRPICNQGGRIFQAERRRKWPGQAAVVVSVVHVAKNCTLAIPCRLDGKPVERITAFLFHAGGNEDPVRLKSNENKSFQGSIVLGMGFTFDDKKPEATSLAEMERLIEKEPRNQERIFPYIGGEDVNTSPTHSHHRYVINFGDMSEKEAWKWPDLMRIVEEKVKPERNVQKRDALRERWWQYAEKRPGLCRAISGMERVLVCGQTSKYRSFVLLKSCYVFDQKLICFPFNSYKEFCILNSNVHIMFSGFMGSSMKDDPVYTPSDCFETFPFPANWETNDLFEAAGQAYYEFRADLMVRTNLGLTKTYNRFHDPDERDADIMTLRALHAAMDRAVLDAYGWTDIPTDCDFLVDYEEEETEEEAPTKARQRKKPWRYRWPDAVRDEVLARLLELNARRAEEERMAGPSAKPPRKPPAGKGKKKPPAPDMFDAGGKTLAEPKAILEPEEPAEAPVERPVPMDERETDEVMAAFRQATRGKGWMTRINLIYLASGILGVKRVSQKTEEILRNHLRTAIRRRIIETDGPDNVRGGPETLAEYPLDELREMFKHVMNKRNQFEREAVIVAMARYLGFTRTTDVSRAAIKSAINSGIRQGILGYQGDCIWRTED